MRPAHNPADVPAEPADPREEPREPDRPPPLAAWLIAIATGTADRDAVAGDLHEEFRAIAAAQGRAVARDWYWRQVRTSLLSVLRRRLPHQSSHSGRPLMSLLQDVRFGWRQLKQRPLTTVVAIGSLVCGIALTSTVFSLLDAAVYRPLPVAAPDRLAVVLSQRSTGINHNFSYPDFLDYRTGQRTFDELLASANLPVTIGTAAGTVLAEAELVSGSYFSTLGVPLGEGRPFVEADLAAGARPVVIVSPGMWRAIAGPDVPLDGREVLLNNRAVAVIGIAPAGFHGIVIGRDVRVWAPIAQQPLLDPSGGNLVTRRTVSWLTLLGRLRTGVTREQAASDLNRVEAVLGPAVSRPETRTLLLAPGRQGDSMLPARSRPILELLLGAALLVLVIGTANVAGLLAARAADRQRELAVRTALGATRLRIVRLQLIETALLASIAVAAALAATQWTAQLALPLLGNADTTPALEVGVDWRVTGFVAALGLAAALLAGLAGLSAPGRRRLASSLADGGRAGSDGPVRRRLHDVLVGAQFAMSLALVVTAALLVRTLANVTAIPTGFDIDRIVLVGVDPQAAGYDAARARQYVVDAERRVALVPGVRHVGFGAIVPLGFGGSRATIDVPGYTASPDEDMEINYNIVSPGYVHAMGLALIDGRTLLDSDPASGPVAAVVNETMARRYWRGGRAVNRTFHLGSATGPAFDVVGVVRDVKYRMLREAPEPSFYYSVHRSSRVRAGVLHVRTEGSARALVEPLRRAAAEVDAAVPVTLGHTLRDQRDLNVADERLAMLIGTVLGIAALVMAAVGLFAAMSQAVGRRTREIGVRMALGAAPAQIARATVAQGARVVAVGGAAGVALALGAGQLIEERLYGLAPHDAVSLGIAALVLAGAALAASWAPARRAAHVDPARALRE